MDPSEVWNDTPECNRCGGPAVPLDPVLAELGKNLRCARCGREWLGSERDWNRADTANVFWKMRNSEPRDAFEQRREAERKAKLERAMQGRW